MVMLVQPHSQQQQIQANLQESLLLSDLTDLTYRDLRHR